MMRGRMRGPLAKTYPVSAAVDAIENGIDKRARRVLAPGWIKFLLAIRDFIPVFVERDVAKAMPEVERAFHADIAARGARLRSRGRRRSRRQQGAPDHRGLEQVL